VKAKKKSKPTKQLAPIDAKSEADICSLKTDNTSTGKSWLLLDGPNLTICNQRSGEGSTGSVSLTRSEFAKFWRWYTTKQNTVKK
jgi:hypothetical protein